MSGNAGSPSLSPSTTPQEPVARKLSNADNRESTHAIACITCSTRKVKCDRQDPSCSNCLRSNIQCEYRAPLPRGPRKRKYPPEEDLHIRLEHYEELLKSFGIVDPANTVMDRTLDLRLKGAPATTAYRRALPLPDGKVVISEQGKPRYIENKLWDSIAEEIPHDQDEEDDEEGQTPGGDFSTPGTMLSGSSNRTTADDGALLLGAYSLAVPGQASTPLKSLYPTREQAWGSWDIFMRNVMPVTKLIHGPSYVADLERALDNPASASRKFDALMFSVVLCAMNTVSDDECEPLFFADQETVLKEYQDRASRALVAADILRSDDLGVLQAFAIYVSCMRDRLDLRTTWHLTGVATRMAMAMGMHRAGAFEKSFKPFELEYRRRTWQQVIVLDSRVGEMSGFGASGVAIESDSKTPGNYNDEDLHPDMTEFPPERTGATEMLWVMCRSAFRECGRQKGLGPLFMGVAKFDMKIAEREKRIAEFEQYLEQNIVRYCDPLEPLHVLVSAMSRTVVHRLRMKAYHPVHNQSGEKLSDREYDACFNSALKIIEYDNFIYGPSNLRGFMWHCRLFYQWDAMMFMLGELKTRGYNDTTIRAWKLVEQNFNSHPEFTECMRRPLNLAVANLCLKAWASREQAQAAKTPGGHIPPAPKFIRLLRERHAPKKTPSPSANGGASIPMPAVAPVDQPDFSAFANASLDPNFFQDDSFGNGSMDWSLWTDSVNIQDPNFFWQMSNMGGR